MNILHSISRRFKALGRLVAALFPTPIPTLPGPMVAWVDDIIELAGFPVNNSMRQAVLTMIMHLGPTVSFKSRAYFVLSLRKAASNQTAYNFIQSIRNEEKRDQKTVTGTDSEVVSEA